MFRLWIERRFSRPVTAAGTVRIGRSAGIVRCCRKKKGPLMKHSFPAPPDSSGVGWDPGLAGIGGGAVSP